MSRIVLLPSAYLPSLGGVEELTRHLALSLLAAGDEVEVWTMQADEVPHPTVETLDGIVVRRFPFPLASSRPSSIPHFLRAGFSSLRALRASLKAYRPDVLHVQCFGPNGAYAAALSRLTRVPLVVSLQGETIMDDHDIFDRSTVLRTALRLGLRRAARVTGCSAFTLADAEKRFGLTAGRGQVIFNGVVVEGADSGVDAPPGPPVIGGRYVLALGRVVEKKGFDLLLRGFAQIAADHPDVQLAIGGDGRMLPALRTLADELDMTERVNFVGRLSRTDVAAAMARSDIFVMPSRLEPFGIVVLEGWRAGTAVVCTSRGGPPEFVDDGVTGVLVDPFDITAVASALDRLLSDAAYRAELGAAGKARVADFAWPVIAESYRRIYAEIA